ncbi:MAG: CHAT domain-containing protein [Bacteroidia bacterium]
MIESISPEEEIKLARLRLSNLPADSLAAQMEERLKLVGLLQKNKQTAEAGSHLDTLSALLNSHNDRGSLFFIRTENLLAGEDFRENKMDSALAHYNNAHEANQALAVLDSSEFLKSLVNTGVILDRIRRYEEALTVYKKTLPVAESYSPTTSDRLAKIYNNLGNTLNHLQRPLEAVVYFRKAADFLYENFPGDYPYTAKTQSYLGDALLLLGRSEEALGLYEDALDIYRKNQADDIGVADIYLRLANAYKEKRDLDKAIDYYRQSIQMYTNAGSHAYYQNVRAGIYQNLALTYMESGDFSSAHENMEEAEKIYHQLFPGNLGLNGQLALNHGLIYFNEHKLPEAKQAFEKASNNYNSQYGEESPYLIYVFYALGSLYEEENDWIKAENQYRTALQIALNTYGPNHYTTARTYMNMAILAKKQQQFDQAETLITQAIQCLYPPFSPQTPQENPELLREIPAAGSITKILWAKAEILRDKGERLGDTTALRAALGTFRFTLDLISRIATDISSQGSRQQLQENNYQLYEAGISTAWKLFEWTSDTSYLQEAFHLSESSKAHLLLEALKESQAKAFAGIPAAVIEKERYIQDQLNLIEKKQYDAAEGPTRPDSAEAALLEQSRFTFRQQYDSLKQSLEVNYPQYYRLRYDQKTAKIDEIQAVLPDTTGFLAFFTGDSNVYVFVLAKHQFTAQKMKIPNLTEQVTSLRSGILDWHYETGKTEKEKTTLLQQYAITSANLFQDLLKPVEDKLPPRLVIVPDGVLGYLPFELLLTEPADLTHSPSRWPYLLRDHAISYNYSATLYRERKEAEAAQPVGKGFIAFAPQFGEGEKEKDRKSIPNTAFSPLRYNMEEAKEIASITGGKAVLGDEATVDHFYKSAPSRAVIHLSSHGKADDRDARYSYIAFADPGDSARKQLLYVADLYNLHLQAELVVLSACETGLGQLYRGEGIASMARAFTYAGARSITTTLWRVNDKASADLMVSYYHHLALGESKDRALQQAKLHLLRTQQDPFLWGGFVTIGDMEPLQKTGIPFWIWGIVAGIVLVAGGFFVYFRNEYYSRKHRTSPGTGPII